MILVAGLAVAGLVGIAAAFYFSIRTGSGKKRSAGVRSAGPGRAGVGGARAGRAGANRAAAGRLQGGRSGDIARPGRTGNAHRAANGGRSADASRAANFSSGDYRAERSTGPNRVMDFGDPELAGGWSRPARSGDHTGGRRRDSDRTEPSARPGARPRHQGPTVPAPAYATASTSKTPKGRRRVGFRKGADVDEEMWPVEAFGGVSDEQFWDDLASDKPLTTTARTAQQDSDSRSRPLDAVPLPDMRAAGSGTYPESRPGPDPVADRTAIQPAYTPTQPAPNLISPVRSATQPVQALPAPVPALPAASQPMSTAAQPSQTRGRRRASTGTGAADEDPLTSAAFSLRPSGPVDGRSSLTPRGARDLSRTPHEAAAPQETPTFSLAETEAASGGYPGGLPPIRQAYGPGLEPVNSYGGTSAYPYSGLPYSDPSPATSSEKTPPYGESYGYSGGHRGSAARPDDPGRRTGTRSHARHGGNGAGDGSRVSRQAYPHGGYQGGSYEGNSYPENGHQAGGYRGNGYQAGYPGGGYPGGGYPGRGYRGPYDPGEDYRRLTRRRLPLAD